MYVAHNKDFTASKNYHMVNALETKMMSDFTHNTSVFER